MHKALLAAFFAAVTLLALGAKPAEAQDAPPPTRYVASTSFGVPFGEERGKFMAFLVEYFLPGYQLNPNVKNFRMLTHNWGSDGAQIILVAEFESWAAIEAPCGQPCDAYEAQHEAPEEGEAGYAEYAENLAVFNKYYSHHADEIYSTNMNRAVVEGRKPSQVGPAASSN